MKFLRIVLCGLLFALPVLGSEMAVRLTDASPSVSPVRNFGKITLVEESSGDKAMTTSDEEWAVKNVSGKPVVALVESLAIEYADGHKSGRKAQYELFFHPDLMKPGDQLSFSQNEPEVALFDKLAVGPVKPKCEVTALWIQFADGSTFGDRRNAESLLAGRRMTLDGLSRLRNVYEQKGPDQFIQEVRKHAEPAAGDSYLDMYFEQLRTYYGQTNDVQGTYNKLKAWLDTAESRQYLLD